MKFFDYAAPASLDEASKLLAQDGSAVLAGGTQLLLSFKWLAPPKLLVNIKRLPGLRGIEVRGEEVWIGATSTLAEVRQSELLRNRFPVVTEAARLMAVPAVATLGTVGGNVAWASPQADLVQVLLLLDAQVDLSGGRSMPLRGFLTGPGQTALAKGELVTGVRLKGVDLQALYLRHSTRKRADAQICSVALTRGRAVLGSCGPTPIVVDLPDGADAVERVMNAASPRDDFRASAAHRLRVVRNLTRRGVEMIGAY